MKPLRNVVITGMGSLNPIGDSVDQSWGNILQGFNGIGSVTENWDSELPVHIAGLVKKDLRDLFTHAQLRRMDRSQQLALAAFMEAWVDADVSEFDPERLAVSLGSGLAGALTFKTAYDTVKEKGVNRMPPFFLPMTMPNGAAGIIALTAGALGGAQTVTSACASGADAIANGLRLIHLNEADIVICGGTEASVFYLTAGAFTVMRALSLNPDPATASRPFDLKRDGFVLAEGAGVIILESEEHARGRGAKIHGRILSASVTSEGHHMVQPDPSGSGPARSMIKALKLADIAPTDVCHINAHATSTPLGDLAESIALEKVFKNHTSNLVVSATKSMTGHMIAAAGAVESIFTVLALKNLVAPPSTNITELDPGVKVPVTNLGAVALPKDKAAIKNSFGFGGHNVSLIFAPA